MRSSVHTLPLPRSAAAAEQRTLPGWLKPKAVVIALVQLGLVAAMLWFCLPQSLGGRAGWVVVSGTSMLPHMHTGDLALVERQSSYHVGEVVAYRVPQGQVGAGYEVIHRIVGGNARKGWVMQGDNRTLPDLWHPHNSDIVGARLIWIPKAYLLLRFLHTPLLLGLLAGFGIFCKILFADGGGEKGDAELETTEQDS
jgi:signal peptidase I